MRADHVSSGIPAIRSTVVEALARHESVVLAISGGLDSMVLLDAATSERADGRLIVATFDHGSGAAASASCELVARRAAECGLECVVGRSEAGPIRSSESAWRAARWGFLRRVAGARGAGVATAHTADDQIETVLMRTMRGAGARGVAGLLTDSDVLRPLIAFRRSELSAYARHRRLTWVEDPTNSSRAFLRNRLRHDILPALRRVRPEIDRELLDLGDRAAAWRRETEAIATSVSRACGAHAVDVDAGLVRTLDTAQLAILWPAVAARVGVTLDRRGIGRLAAFCPDSRVGARIQLSGGWEVVRSRDAFQLRFANSGVAREIVLDVAAETRWGSWAFWPSRSSSVSPPGGRASGWEAALPTDEPIRVRAWRRGDRLGDGEGRLGRKVKQVLNDAGVTGHERQGWPVVLCGDRIVWVPGVRRSDAATERSGRPSLHLACARYSG